MNETEGPQKFVDVLKHKNSMIQTHSWAVFLQLAVKTGCSFVWVVVTRRY